MFAADSGVNQPTPPATDSPPAPVPPSVPPATPDTRPPPPSVPPRASAGEMLAAARRDWGVSTREVADYLHLAIDAIDALEQNAYERLPGETFTKGYLRSYARLLRLDPEEVIRRANLQPEQMSDIPVTKASPPSATRHLRPRKPSSGSGRTLLVLALIGGLGWFAYSQAPNFEFSQLSQILSRYFPMPGQPGATPVVKDVEQSALIPRK